MINDKSIRTILANETAEPNIIQSGIIENRNKK